MADIIFVLLTGFVTGMTTIVFGFGGGFVVVPLVYHLVSASGEQPGQAMHIAVATSTAVMIFTAGYATFAQWRSGNLLREILFPLIFYIAMGAVLGAFASSLLADGTVRLLFVIYILVTIADCLFRPGFLVKPVGAALSPSTLLIGGPLMGVIATLLGVGGERDDGTFAASPWARDAALRQCGQRVVDPCRRRGGIDVRRFGLEGNDGAALCGLCQSGAARAVGHERCRGNDGCQEVAVEGQ